MECPTCKSPTTKYPGGTSKKTGKPYNARTSCDNPECSYVLWEKDAPKTAKNGSYAPKTPLDSDILNRLAARLDKLDEMDRKLDNIIAYFIDNQKDKIREKSWVAPQPTTSSTPSEIPLPKEE